MKQGRTPFMECLVCLAGLVLLFVAIIGFRQKVSIEFLWFNGDAPLFDQRCSRQALQVPIGPPPYPCTSSSSCVPLLGIS